MNSIVQTGAKPVRTNARPDGFFDRLGATLRAKPHYFVLAVILALVLLPVAVWLDLRNLAEESLTRQATELNSTITDIRGYYGQNVIGRIQQNGGNAVPVHNYESTPGGIPIPATLSIELGSIIGKRGTNLRYRFVSDFVFKSRAGHELDAFEAAALSTFRAYVSARDKPISEVSGDLFSQRIRMAVPVIMGQACVDCHNAHPESPKTDWKVGDVRAIQAVTIDQPLAENVLSFKYLLAYLLAAGLFGSTFAVLQWRQARQFASMNGELEETNSFLAAISLKISKYLSPQVYKSNFSGERDAVISTERKKLTIFFSDIKDFTVTTERLQPEELTELLNEYFTEMTTIAHAHGATVDKFIGDAILCFFGDPHTKGAAADAQDCLDMAIAMQRRMVEMSRDWRQRGVEKPFEARMGINTGYCNVGNFGSADRMDYTIIGAEANLAARLQSIAEPGGIVMSYETYALVEEFVQAHPLEPITLKGISRPIIPYAVDNVLAPTADNAPVFESNAEGFSLRVDLDGLKGEEARAAEATLKSALSELKRRRAAE